MIIGIDPGQTGALAFYEAGKIIAVVDMPVMARIHGKGQKVDAYTLGTLIMSNRGHLGEAVMEQVDGRPRRTGTGEQVAMGGTSGFNFGESFGIVEGVLGALQIPLRLVTPRIWKKAAGLIGKDKDAARTMAIQLHPEVAEELTRKKDIGRADAICIAHFG